MHTCDRPEESSDNLKFNDRHFDIGPDGRDSLGTLSPEKYLRKFALMAVGFTSNTLSTVRFFVSFASTSD